MISDENQPKRITTSDEDFTEVHYRLLLRMAKATYSFVTYDSIPWGTRFILWRHDLDYSINRAAALASIEAEEGITATYFVNPRSDFYNPFEPDQARLLKHILGMGHRLGLHLDANCNDLEDEDQLNRRVMQEMSWLEDAFDVRPVVFSFHNPGVAQLKWDADCYGGAINTYSRRFKTEIPYCSDSNGYWRFRRLFDVLTDTKDPCLQVLTHPGWWQEAVMPPRQRIFRSVFGRAASTMRAYDTNMQLQDRTNHVGAATHLRFLKNTHPRLFDLCDYLWNSCHFDSLFVELWRLHEKQLIMLSKAELLKQWSVPVFEVNAFFESPSFAKDGWRLFAVIFGKTWQNAASLDISEYQTWVDLRNALFHGRSAAPSQCLEDGCIFLCSAIISLSSWGKTQPIQYSGIDHLDAIGIPTFKTADGSHTDFMEQVEDDNAYSILTKWEHLKANFLNVGDVDTEQELVMRR
jgi:hypothetical protein